MKIFYVLLGILFTLGLIIYFFGNSTLKNTLVVDNDREFNTNVSLPNSLIRSFPDTDFSKINKNLEKIVSGGPGKDGIPAIDSPKFENISNFNRSDSVQAIVMRDEDKIKVYPYNILIWHEIVNDVVGGVPVAITFCPLCGSAIVFDRTMSDGIITTFGVSGFLVESNMIMYDRSSESLWQQSTGEALAGKYFQDNLNLISFQLMTVGEVRKNFPNALVLSEDTGHNRNYERNPYSGYEESDDFIFNPSNLDSSYFSKEIFVAFKVDDIPVAIPWLNIKDGEKYTTNVEGSLIKIEKVNNELFIKNDKGEELSFYFEMWFSWAVQNLEKGGIVFDPAK